MIGNPDLPLRGRTILTTRALGQGEKLRKGLEQAGATVIHIPTIEFAPPPTWTAVDDAIHRLPDYDWIIFTSANAVDAFLDRAGTLPEVAVAVVGAQTAHQLGKRGVNVDLVPERFHAEGLLAHFPTSLKGTRILLPRAEVADETLPETLRSRGATVDVAAVYRTLVPETGRDQLRGLLASRKIDCITLTSGSTVRNLVEMLGGPSALPLLAHPAIAVIGPVTSEAATRIGLNVDIEPNTASIPALITAITTHFS